MSGEYERLGIPMDLELKWVKTKLHERDKHILKLAEENSKLREDMREDIREGISLRDHFAGLAMQSLIAGGKGENWWAEKDFAWNAYRQADAMLAEREKKDD
jgi:hypothetical protein